MSNYKLGKKPAVHDYKTLKLDYYLDAKAAQIQIPQACDYTSKVNVKWGMLKNDSVGDCAIAGPAHTEMIWNFNEGRSFIPTDQQVISDYSKVSGYDPRKDQPNGENPTDVGCNLLQVMKYWKKNGICGRKIDGYASVDPQNKLQVQAAIYLFGSVIIGVALPAGAKNSPWYLPNGWRQNRNWRPGTWGGHCIVSGKYNMASNNIPVVTWGALKDMSWGFLGQYCDEMYVPLSMDWVGDDKKAINGFDYASLQADLKLFH